MNTIPLWITIVSSIGIPLLVSISTYLILLQAVKKEKKDFKLRQEELEAQRKRDLSDDAIDLYDRMKKEAEELRAQIAELRELCDTETKMRKELEAKFDSENEKYEELQTVVYVLQSRQKSYERYITKLVRQLRDNNIEPAKRPVEIEN